MRMYRRKMSLRTVEWCLAWGKPMREARDPCTRRATRRASIRSRGLRRLGVPCNSHDARLGFRHPAAHPLGGGHHEYPTPSPSRWRAAWRCADVITFVTRSPPPSRSRTSTLTVGRGGERPTPQDSTAPPRLLHRARVSRADTAQRQAMTVRPSTADSLVTGNNRISAALGACHCPSPMRPGVHVPCRRSSTGSRREPDRYRA